MVSIFDNITQAQETMSDYPGKIAYTLFVKDCNLDCNYCYNLHRFDNGFEPINVDEIIEIVKAHPNFYGGFVISGGEPTLYDDLPLLTEKLKDETNLPVTIFTNGNNIDRLIGNESISVDYKWPLNKYLEYTKKEPPTDLVKILNTMNSKNGIIRTTVTSLHKSLAGIMEKELFDIRDGNTDFIWNVQTYYDCQFVNRREELINIPDYTKTLNEAVMEFYRITSNYKGRTNV